MEVFYTFLVPLIFQHGGKTYTCWGYREVDDTVESFSATLGDEAWTKATSFTDKELISEFIKLLPEKPVKRKRRKKA